MNGRLTTVLILACEEAVERGDEVIVPILCGDGSRVGLRATPRIWKLIGAAALAAQQPKPKKIIEPKRTPEAKPLIIKPSGGLL